MPYQSQLEQKIIDLNLPKEIKELSTPNTIKLFFDEEITKHTLFTSKQITSEFFINILEIKILGRRKPSIDILYKLIQNRIASELRMALKHKKIKKWNNYTYKVI